MHPALVRFSGTQVRAQGVARGAASLAARSRPRGEKGFTPRDVWQRFACGLLWCTCFLQQ